MRTQTALIEQIYGHPIPDRPNSGAIEEDQE
jgi:hypothetical protein